MKKMFKRFLSILIATATCLSMGLNAFATEVTASSSTRGDLVVEDGIMPRGNISGYAYAVISPQNTEMTIYCDSYVMPFETSGMGITVETKCSGGTYNVGVRGYARKGTAGNFDSSMTTNDHRYWSLTHKGCSEYVVYFTGVTTEFEAQVWIYG